MLRTLCRLRQAQGSSHHSLPNSSFEHATKDGRPMSRGKRHLQYMKAANPDGKPHEFTHGMRASRRKGLDPSVFRHRAREDQELFQITRTHRESIDAIGQRQGGALLSLAAQEAMQSARITSELLPGAYVERHVDGDYLEKDVGVVLSIVAGETRQISKDIVVMTVSGCFERWRRQDIALFIPSFISEKEAYKAGVAYQTQEPAQAPSAASSDSTVLEGEIFDEKRFMARAYICARTRVLMRQIEEQQQLISPVFGQHLLDNLNRIGIKDGTITASELSAVLLADAGRTEVEAKEESVTPAGVIAAHRLMLAHGHIFKVDEYSHQTTNLFTIHSPEERAAMSTVSSWMEDWCNKSKSPGAGTHIMNAFFVKARKMMSLREPALLDPTKMFGEPKAVRTEATENLPDWTEEDRQILTFVRIAVSSRRLRMASSAMASYITFILKECGLPVSFEVEALERSESPQEAIGVMAERQNHTVKLLTMLGVMTPWQDTTLLQVDMSVVDDIKACSIRPEKTVMRLDDDIRTEFTHPVYVIDDASAIELDDGVSIERTPDDDVVWLHVLIADPSTAIQPGDAVAEMARRQHTSLYLPTLQCGLLPQAFGKSLDLRPKEDKSHRTNALRLSAKVNIKTGLCIDIDVGLSVLTNVRTVTYDEATATIARFASGHGDQDRTAQDLFLLSRAGLAIKNRRCDIGGTFNQNFASRQVQISPSEVPESPLWQLPQIGSRIPEFQGFPGIDIKERVQHFLSDKNLSSNDLIGELMILGGRIAGSWIASRGLPGLYRGQPRPSDAEIAKLRSLVDEQNFLSLERFWQSAVQFPSSTMSHLPAEHFLLGIGTRESFESVAARGEKDPLLDGGYMRVTSPLRRYGDLFLHWQIKSSLRNERPLFDAQDILKNVPRFMRMDKWADSLKKSSDTFWFDLALYRAHLYRTMVQKGAIVATPELDAKHASGMFFLENTHDARVTFAEVRTQMNLEERVRVVLGVSRIPLRCAWDSKDGKNMPVSGQHLRVRFCPPGLDMMNKSSLVMPV